MSGPYVSFRWGKPRSFPFLSTEPRSGRFAAPPYRAWTNFVRQQITGMYGLIVGGTFIGVLRAEHADPLSISTTTAEQIDGN